MKRMIELGIRAGGSGMYREDLIWEEFSSDKVDIGECLSSVIRTLSKALPPARRLRAISIGCGNEPQFKILQSTFQGGLYLYDIEKAALDTIRARLKRQWIKHVTPVLGDYTKDFFKAEKAKSFLTRRLDGRRLDFIALDHALYYCEESDWLGFFENLCRHILASKGAIHATMMAPDIRNKRTTSWLYAHFAGKFFGAKNDQNLLRFAGELQGARAFKDAKLRTKTSRVEFFVNDFAEFMSVIWMIMLYPNVHDYDRAQREEITEYVYKHFWKPKRPLQQTQHHLAVYKGIRGMYIAPL